MQDLSAQTGIDNTDGNYLNGKLASSQTLVSIGVNQDIIQFFQKLMDLASLSPNNLDDNEANGYQLISALQEISRNIWIATESLKGSINIADETTARTGSNNTEAMTPLRVLDALRNGTNFLAQTSFPGVVERATDAERDAGTYNKFIDAQLLDGFNGGMKQKIIDIGTWDMDTTSGVVVAHGLTFADIRGIKVLIRDDNQTVLAPLDLYSGGASGGNYLIDATNVNLNRQAGGPFDTTEYNSTLASRGFIVIDYLS